MKVRTVSFHSASEAELAAHERTPASLWLKWTISCGVGEFLGMAVAAGTAALFVAVVCEPATLLSRIASLLVMVVAGALEGISIGFLQWRVLRRVFPRVTAREWLIPTISVAAGGWFIGMLPQMFFEGGEGTQTTPEPSPQIVMIFATVFESLGAVVLTGALTGIVAGLTIGAVTGAGLVRLHRGGS